MAVVHKQIYRKGPFGGELNTTLCGRMAMSRWDENDGINVAEKDAEVTCKFCLHKIDLFHKRLSTKRDES